MSVIKVCDTFDLTLDEFKTVIEKEAFDEDNKATFIIGNRYCLVEKTEEGKFLLVAHAPMVDHINNESINVPEKEMKERWIEDAMVVWNYQGEEPVSFISDKYAINENKPVCHYPTGDGYAIVTGTMDNGMSVLMETHFNSVWLIDTEITKDNMADLYQKSLDSFNDVDIKEMQTYLLDDIPSLELLVQAGNIIKKREGRCDFLKSIYQDIKELPDELWTSRVKALLKNEKELERD